MKNRLALLIQFVIAILIYTGVSATPLSTCCQPVPDAGTMAGNNKLSGDPYLRLNEIDRHAARDFYRKFPQVTNDKWLKLENGYLARFTDQGILCKVFYDEKGRYLVSTRYYGEDALPPAVKKQVQQQYPGYSIGVITEVTAEKEASYFIHIKDRYTVKTLKVFDKQLTVMENRVNGECGDNNPELANTNPD